MTFNTDFSKILLEIDDSQRFEKLALEVFDYQFKHVRPYRAYCELLGRPKPKTLEEIPFLPIEFFKTKSIVDDSSGWEIIFKSSGTGNTGRSQHFVRNTQLYKKVSKRIFEEKFGKLRGKVILALLPNYQMQGDSSLIYMLNHFIQESSEANSGFYLNEFQQLKKIIYESLSLKKEVVLFGVSYALLDLAEMNFDLSGVKVIETGGMKGRRKEMPKLELQKNLIRELNLDTIYSEYGMTELLSQAYAAHNTPFENPPWMKILLREQNDPFAWLPQESTKPGGISIVDLANIHSCSFIHTQDLGRYNQGGFELMGRFDHSDVRGCNQLIIV